MAKAVPPTGSCRRPHPVTRRPVVACDACDDRRKSASAADRQVPATHTRR